MKKVLVALLFLISVVPLLFAADKEGGIVGTGVVGQVTGLRQFEVSGMQFEIERNVRITGLENLDDLKMGMTLAVKASREGSDWFATDIRRVPVIVGPVTGNAEVMGIPVIGDLPDAERVSIDGFWSEAGIVITYAEAVFSGVDRITGPITQIQRVGGLLPQDNVTLPDRNDEIFTVTGTYSDGLFSVSNLQEGLFLDQQPNLLMAEGFLSKPDRNGEASLLGVVARQAIADNGQANPNKKSIRCAFNGRLDFNLEDVAPDDRETVLALCANVPR